MMDATQFTSVCEQSGFQALGKYATRHGEILIGEKYVNWFPDFPRPHWQVLWVIARGDIDAAQRIYITGQEDGYMTPLMVPRNLRVNAAKLAAESYMDDAVEVGRYH